MIAVVNHIQAKDEDSFNEILKRFSKRKRFVDKFPGFKGFKLFASKEDLAIMVMTLWDSKEDFKRWVESEEFEKAHKGRGDRKINADSKGIVYDVVF